MITITLNKIKEHDPCEDGWKTLLKSKGKTKADDAAWAAAGVKQEQLFRAALEAA